MEPIGRGGNIVMIAFAGKLPGISLQHQFEHAILAGRAYRRGKLPFLWGNIRDRNAGCKVPVRLK